MGHGEWVPQLWMVLSFIGLLLSIAVLPLVVPDFWGKVRNQGIVVAVFSAPIVFIYLTNSPKALLHSMEEYVSFVILLSSLYIVSGGIWISGGLKGTPLVNTAILGIGSVLSNFLGTTGASMVLIRPFLAANGHRKHRAHLPIFLIFIVSNISGLLTPLGDPPLFLGFLRGVPFFWTLRLFPQWIFAVSILLAVFYCFDRFVFKDTAPVAKSDGGDKSPLKLNGKRNLLCLATIVGSVFLPTPYREIVMVAAILVTLKITPEQYHKGNNFEYHAIKEVATLFLGIFITMIPALEILQLKGASLGVTAPWQFFWASGAFSSFLDNAPTYLTFIALGQGLKLGGPFMDVPVNILIAVSVGAVFFGANTYIGNAPNFMVRSIAASSGWKMPSFFGYMLWSGCILIPLFVLVTFVFFLG